VSIDELTDKELLCLCDYTYTRGQVWQTNGWCPPGHDPSFQRAAVVDETPVQHPKMDCDTGMWGGR
jgi:hypothetical protein